MKISFSTTDINHTNYSYLALINQYDYINIKQLYEDSSLIQYYKTIRPLKACMFVQGVPDSVITFKEQQWIVNYLNSDIFIIPSYINDCNYTMQLYYKWIKDCNVTSKLGARLQGHCQDELMKCYSAFDVTYICLSSMSNAFYGNDLKEIGKNRINFLKNLYFGEKIGQWGKVFHLQNLTSIQEIQELSNHYIRSYVHSINASDAIVLGCNEKTYDDNVET